MSQPRFVHLQVHSDFSPMIFEFRPSIAMLPPDSVWQNISEFLARLRGEAEISPPMDNLAKIVAKGFDAKRSFRPKMKKRYSGLKIICRKSAVHVAICAPDFGFLLSLCSRACRTRAGGFSTFLFKEL